MLRNRGLAFKLSLFFGVSSGLVFIASFGYNYVYSRRIIERDAQDKAKNLADATVNRIEAVLRPIQRVPEGTARFLEHGAVGSEQLLTLLRESVRDNEDISGAAVAFEPHAFTRGVERFAPHFYRAGAELRLVDLETDADDYFKQDWYQIPKELERPDWSEPYYAEGGGNILMATYSVPFHRTARGAGRLAGVATADISLEWLTEIVAGVRVLQSGYAFLLSKNGTLVTHPRHELIMNATFFGLAEGAGDRELRQIGREMIGGASGFATVRAGVFEQESWLYYAPIPASGWSLGIVFPKAELYADVSRLTWMVGLLGGSGLLLLSVATIVMARSFTGPLRRMARATQQLAAGDLDFGLPPAATGDEVGRLTASFEAMRTSLKAHIRRLTETTAAKERIESELQIAHDIQMNILPKTFPPFPERTEFEVDALIRPAREVGGDFYDFYFCTPRLFCFLIADVSGKGVPASLFMAITRTLLKTVAKEEAAPERILGRVNDELSRDNDSNMFVSVFCGMLSTDTGRLEYANAGHNPPLLVRPGRDATFLEGARGAVLGAAEGLPFRSERLTLAPGDFVLLYTDGVTEAENGRGEFYCAGRLQAAMAGLETRRPREVLDGVMRGVAAFAGDAPQSDDITLLLVRYAGAAAQAATGR